MVRVMISGILVCMQGSECCRWLDSRLIGSTLPYMGAPRGGAPYPGAPQPPLEHLDIGAHPPHQDMEPSYARAVHRGPIPGGAKYPSAPQPPLEHLDIGAHPPHQDMEPSYARAEHRGPISRWGSISRWGPATPGTPGYWCSPTPPGYGTFVCKGRTWNTVGEPFPGGGSISRWAPAPLEHLDIEITLEAPPSEDALGWLLWTWMLYGVNVLLIFYQKQQRKANFFKFCDFYIFFSLPFDTLSKPSLTMNPERSLTSFWVWLPSGELSVIYRGDALCIWVFLFIIVSIIVFIFVLLSVSEFLSMIATGKAVGYI